MPDFLQKFIAWWVRNAGYIEPIATSLSALAAWFSIRMVYKTFKQARLDRIMDLHANRPSFRLIAERIELVSDIQ